MDFHGFDEPHADVPADAPAPQTAAPAIAQNLQEPDLTAAAGRDLKLPPFCSADATSWFQRVEIIFRIRQIRNDSSKADHVLAALPEDTFPLISGWLADQGDTLQYNKLRRKILNNDPPPVRYSRAGRLLTKMRPPMGGSIVEASLLDPTQ